MDTWSDFARRVEANNGVWGGCWRRKKEDRPKADQYETRRLGQAPHAQAEGDKHDRPNRGKDAQAVRRQVQSNSAQLTLYLGIL